MPNTRLKVYRKQSNFTQLDLARASGVTQAYVSMVEAGKRELMVDVASRMAVALGVSVGELMEVCGWCRGPGAGDRIAAFGYRHCPECGRGI